jgi:hypothetical protein
MRKWGDREIESVIKIRIDQDRILLRPVLRDYGGQVAPAYAEAPADKHCVSTKNHKLRRSFQV